MGLKTPFGSAANLLNEPQPENLAAIFHFSAVRVPAIDIPDAQAGVLSGAHAGLASLQDGSGVTSCGGNASFAAGLMPDMDIHMADQDQTAPVMKQEFGNSL